MTYDPHAEVARLQMEVRKLRGQLEAAIKFLSAERAEAVKAAPPVPISASARQHASFWEAIARSHIEGNGSVWGVHVTEMSRWVDSMGNVAFKMMTRTDGDPSKHEVTGRIYGDEIYIENVNVTKEYLNYI